MASQRFCAGDGVRDKVGTWELRYVGADYVFMVGIHDEFSDTDHLIMTRVMRRALFDAIEWERGPFTHAGDED